MLTSYLLLEVQVLILSELDAPLPVERPSLDGLKTLVVLDTPEPVIVKLHGGVGAFPIGIPPGPLCGKLLQSHLLQEKKFRKLAYPELPSYKQDQTTGVYHSFRNANVNVNLGKLLYIQSICYLNHTHAFSKYFGYLKITYMHFTVFRLP